MSLEPSDVFGGSKLVEKLSEQLEDVFPHYIPTPTDELSLIMYRAGQRSVVEYIKSISQES